MSSLPTDADNLFVILSAKTMNPKLTVVTRASEEEAEEKLRRAGADTVFAPFSMAGHRLAQALTRFCYANNNAPGCLVRDLQEFVGPPQYVHLPRTFQTSIGFQRQFTATTALNSDFVWFKGTHEKDVVDNINVSYNPTTGLPLPFSNRANRPFPDWGIVSMNAHLGKSEYRGLQTSLTKRFSQNWQGSINYTLSLGFGLTFLLAGMGLAGMVHTARNLAQLVVRAGRSEPVFAGEDALDSVSLMSNCTLVGVPPLTAVNTTPPTVTVSAAETDAAVTVPRAYDCWAVDTIFSRFACRSPTTGLICPRATRIVCMAGAYREPDVTHS